LKLPRRRSATKLPKNAEQYVIPMNMMARYKALISVHWRGCPFMKTTIPPKGEESDTFEDVSDQDAPKSY
jgi:hypothetical protein